MEKQIQTAIDGGAKVLTGGKRLKRLGYFLAPTILTDITHTKEHGRNHEEVGGDHILRMVCQERVPGLR